jgi:hypothetical protein
MSSAVFGRGIPPSGNDADVIVKLGADNYNVTWGQRVTTEQLEAAISEAVTNVLAQAKTQAEETFYQKPAEGIPETDLAGSVTARLSKADSAYQKPVGGIGQTDLAVELQDKITGAVGADFVDEKVAGLVSNETMQTAIEAAFKGTFTYGGKVDSSANLPQTAPNFQVWQSPDGNVFAVNDNGVLSWLPFAPEMNMSAYSNTEQMNAAIAESLLSAKAYAETQAENKLPNTTQYAGSSSIGGAANSVAGKLTIQANGVTQEVFDGSSSQTLDITPSLINAVTKPANSTDGAIAIIDTLGNITASGKRITDMTQASTPAALPGTAASYTNFINQPVGGLASISASGTAVTGSPIYYVIRQVATGTLSANDAVGAYGKISFLGLGSTPSATMSDIIFLRVGSSYINRCNILYGGGAHGYETISIVEGLFAKDSSGREFMVFRVTSNDSDGILSFQGWSLGKFIETKPIEVLSSSAFSGKYTIMQDANPQGEDISWNVGAAQLTGMFWTKQDGTRKRVFRATFRGRITPGETTWITLTNVDAFLGWGEVCKIIDGGNTDYPINYSDPGYLNINTKFNQGKVTTKLSVLDGNTAPWNIPSGTNNALVTFYYTRTDA